MNNNHLEESRPNEGEGYYGIGFQFEALAGLKNANSLANFVFYELSNGMDRPQKLSTCGEYVNLVMPWLKEYSSVTSFNCMSERKQLDFANSLQQRTGYVMVGLLNKKKLKSRGGEAKSLSRDNAIGVIFQELGELKDSRMPPTTAMESILPLLTDFHECKPKPAQFTICKDILKSLPWKICVGLAYKNGCNKEECKFLHSAEEADELAEPIDLEGEVAELVVKKKEKTHEPVSGFLKDRITKDIKTSEIVDATQFFFKRDFAVYFTPYNIMNLLDSRELTCSLELVEGRPYLVAHGSFKFDSLPTIVLGGERKPILTHEELEAVRLLPHFMSDDGRIVLVSNYALPVLPDWTQSFCNYSQSITDLFTNQLYNGVDTRTCFMMKYTKEILAKLVVEGASYSRKQVFNRLMSLMKSRHGNDIDDAARIFKWINSQEYLTDVENVFDLSRSQIHNRLKNTVKSKLATSLRDYNMTHRMMQITSIRNCFVKTVACLVPILSSYFFGHVKIMTTLTTLSFCASASYLAEDYEIIGSELKRNHTLLESESLRPLKISLLSKLSLKRQHCRNEKLDEAARLLEKNVIVADFDESCSEDEVVGVYGSVIRGADVVIPSKDTEELNAATIIRMGEKKPYNRSYFRKFRRFAKKMFRRFGKHEITVMDTYAYLCQQYGPKRAGRMMELYGVTYETYFSKCKMFVKDEAYVGKNDDNYKPRMIWSRDEWFVVNFGPWFYSVGNIVKKFIGQKNGVYSSGMTPAEVGAVGDRINSFANIFEGDVSNWDGSLHEGFLKIEQDFMEICCDGLPDQFEELLSIWNVVNGFAASPNGVIFVFLDRCRRSGDLWTSSFNSLINYLIVLFALELDTESHDVCYMMLGDDGICGTNVNINAPYLVSVYKELGMKVELLERDSIFDATYCSGYFYPVGGKCVWGNMPFRQFSKFGINFGNHPERKHKGLLYGTAKGMLCSAGHVPIFGAFLRAIADSAETNRVKEIRDNRHENPFRHQGGVVLYPEFDTYCWFAEKYGLTVQEIFNIEECLENTIDINMFPIIFEEELFLSCFQIDAGLEESVEFEHFLDGDLSLFKEAFDEEVEKLKMASDLNISAYQAGVLFGTDEVDNFNNAASYAPQAHGFLSLVSSYNLFLGATLHYWHNRVALLFLNKKKNGKKKKAKSKKPVSGIANVKQKEQSSGWKKALGNLMRAGGGAIGSYFGGPVGSTLGTAAGSALSKITGMGDYKIRSNSLMSSNVSFGNGNIRITNREYIGDVYSATSFTTVTYDINPGLPVSFPWLAVLAENYQRYDIHGLCYEFNSTAGYLTTTQAQGVVVMSTQYDPNASPFVNRREMEAYVYTTSSIVTSSLLHCVECDPSDRPLEDMYLRYGATNDDKRFDDLGTLTIAVQGCPTAGVLLGELWVTYDVTLQMPRLEPHGYGTASWCRFNIGAYTNTDPLGTLLVSPTGTLDCEITNDTGYKRLAFPPMLDYGYFMVTLVWVGSSTASMAATITPTGCTLIEGAWRLSAFNRVQSSNGFTSDRFFTCFILNINARNASFSLSSLTLPVSGVSCDLYITQMGNPSSTLSVDSYSQALSERGLWVVHPEQKKVINLSDFSHKQTRYDTSSYIEDDEKECMDELDDLREFERFRRNKRFS